VLAGAWVASEKQDGIVPIDVVEMFGSIEDAEALLEVGLWEKHEHGYKFHEWEHWQKHLAKQREIKEKRAEAGRKGGQRKAENMRLANARICQENASSKNVAKSSKLDPIPIPINLSNDKLSVPEKISGSPKAADPIDEELCQLLEDKLHEIGVRSAKANTQWLNASRLLRKRDGYTPEQVEWMIHWVTNHDFWSLNIHSMPKLRKHFERLVLEAKNKTTKSADIYDKVAI
jgi:hypothetical protein